ncbi:hypothetical protein FGD67_06200 [Colwellia sp. M166]|uniref:hypothetical protein n=1 Tax=Colwellia sp. M166 TaxID=2583805 RepID=UPI00211EDD7B|nr:hypothetical protein [Colwellia sp. M166]UUO22822.1 hypothetical protein FGD67_06200 [Colwellia sp. M166]
MPLTTATKNIMLDAITPDSIKLHSGDPTAAGTANEISGATAACTYAAAASGERDLSATLEIDVPLGATVSHYTVWQGETLRAYHQFDSNPETYANAGKAKVTSAKISLPDV